MLKKRGNKMIKLLDLQFVDILRIVMNVSDLAIVINSKCRKFYLMDTHFKHFIGLIKQ